jgi:hypothetical protein
LGSSPSPTTSVSLAYLSAPSFFSAFFSALFFPIFFVPRDETALPVGQQQQRSLPFHDFSTACLSTFPISSSCYSYFNPIFALLPCFLCFGDPRALLWFFLAHASNSNVEIAELPVEERKNPSMI